MRAADEHERHLVGAEQVAAGWLGYRPAALTAVAATERRLGVALPPSYRAFLLASDGWRNVGGWIEEVRPCAKVAWLRDTEQGRNLLDLLLEPAGDQDPDDGGRRFMHAVLQRSLLVAGGEDLRTLDGQNAWLLDPSEPDRNGEWAAWQFIPGPSGMWWHASFAELFHQSARGLDR